MQQSVASAKEGDADRTYRRYCPVRAWTRLRFLEGARAGDGYEVKLQHTSIDSIY